MPKFKPQSLFFLLILLIVLFATISLKSFCSSFKGIAKCFTFGSFFLIKAEREKLTSLFVFGDYDNANWHLTLGQKRLQEAGAQRQVGNYALASALTKRAKNEIEKADPYFQSAFKSGEDVNYLKELMEKMTRELNKFK